LYAPITYDGLLMLESGATQVKTTQGGISFAVRVTPRGGRDSVERWDSDSAGRAYLKVRLRAVAEDGKANAALLELLAKTLDLPRSAVAISSGFTARTKIVQIAGDASALSHRLQTIGEKN